MRDDQRLYASKHYTNRSIDEVLPDNAWKGQPCFVVGGGPSLLNFNWESLKGRRTIGVNRAFEFFDPTIIFSMDTRFLNWLANGTYATNVSDGGAAYDKFKESQAYKVWLATYRLSLPEDFFIIKVRLNYDFGKWAFTFTMKDGLGHGDNSGYAALNLAVCLGADPIYLLGFDCKHENGRTHHHAGHPIAQKAETVENFVKFFSRAASIIKPRGINIINLNPDSALNCWPKMPAEEILC